MLERQRFTRTDDQLVAREIHSRFRAVNRTALAGVLDLDGQSIMQISASEPAAFPRRLECVGGYKFGVMMQSA